MTMLNIETLKVGDKVAVARPGNWTTASEGIYTVVKVNKVRIVVQREDDSYQREFSAKSGRELNKTYGVYMCPCLETVSEQTARNEYLQRQREINNAWSVLKKAAASENIQQVDEAVAALKKLLAQS